MNAVRFGARIEVERPEIQAVFGLKKLDEVQEQKVLLENALADLPDDQVQIRLNTAKLSGFLGDVYVLAADIQVEGVPYAPRVLGAWGDTILPISVQKLFKKVEKTTRTVMRAYGLSPSDKKTDS